MPPITSLLVANRGEIARRIFRTARSMGITCVAVYSDADADSPHVAEADLAVRLPGLSPTDTYLRTDLLLQAAARSGADAVHPGYGFLSERADFASAVVDAGLTWVGPPAAAIAAMGSKIGSKELMRAAGVPTLPSIVVPETGDADGDEADALGWPLLVKASAGGGGRGMRIVERIDDLAEAVSGARREAEAAFGDGTLFLERYVTDPRHIEVQILADGHGDVVALFERECSIQRRHQKIIEESPSPVVSSSQRARLCDAATAAARAVGYTNAGTVEFVLDPAGTDADGSFYFLEMNTRLQVEHPVTELVTGCDLVRLQLLVAEGQALPPEVHAALSRGPVGHAVEARIYAEDPAADWLPSTGTVHRFEIPAASPVSASSADGSPAEDGTSLRVDSGVESGSTVSPHYDPMLAKVITHGPTRAEAVAALARVLSTSAIHGVTTNRDLLVRTLRHPAFAAGDIDTGFLERHDLSKLSAPLADAQAVERHAVAAALTGRAHRRAQATVQPAMPSGWRNNPSQLEQTTFDVQDHSITVGYRFDRAGSHVELIEIDGGDQLMVVGQLDADSVVLTVDDVTRRYRVARAAHTTFVDGPDGSTVLVEQERFPIPGSQVPAGSAVAPMPGGVARVNVAVGDHVQAGQDLVVLEAMKMEHTVHAAIEGTVAEVMVTPGTQVESGQVLVVLEETAGPGEQTDDR
ncbi:MAG TPA: biotin carboxylase N-terminal domain-containing protein [Acidimicrobiales bacterium]|nr:biotin carboxylase N-terminal domain-containing protein [Acidimicrobiales bacterium]